MAAAVDAAAAAAAGTARAGLPPTFLLIALLFVPGVAVLLCLDFWRLCRRDPDGRDSSGNGRHSVLVGNSSFIWKRGPSKKKTKPLSDATYVNGLDGSIAGGGGGGAGTPTALPGSTPDATITTTTTPPTITTPPAVPDIAAELPYLLPADAASAPSPSPQASPVPAQRTRSGETPSQRRLRRKSSDEDYQCPGGDGEMPYRSPADELRRSVPTAEEEPYYAVPVHRVAAEPAPLPPPRRRQART